MEGGRRRVEGGRWRVEDGGWRVEGGELDERGKYACSISIVSWILSHLYLLVTFDPQLSGYLHLPLQGKGSGASIESADAVSIARPGK